MKFAKQVLLSLVLFVSLQFFAFFATILAWIGIDTKDVHFVAADTYNGMVDAFTEGRAEAVLAGGTEGPRMVRDKARGHVLLDTMITKPWSQYECCHLVANRAWAVQNPAASKRVTRAIIKATESKNDTWLAAMMAGPSWGTCSSPSTRTHHSAR